MGQLAAAAPALRRLLAALLLSASPPLLAQPPPEAVPQATFGGSPARNMASPEKGLPQDWDLETGRNVKWVADLGSEAYGGPVVAGGKVFVGTNNEHPRDPQVEGDRGVVMAFRESDGGFLWQATHDKLGSGAMNDWPLQGVCSTPTVYGQRLYYVSNRGELVCLDTEGFTDGENDGPYREEEATGPAHADVVWKLDMPGELGVFPKNMSASSPVVVGDRVFTLTSNGLDDEGRVKAPGAPSFLAVDRHSGKVLWSDASPGSGLVEGQWSNPSYGVIGGRPQVIFPGGDGWLYSFEPQTGELLWKFDGNGEDREATEARARNAFVSSAVIWEDWVYIGVGRDPEAGAGKGHLWALDATRKGDSTPGVVWHFSGKDFGRTISTVAIDSDVLYAADLNGFLYALDPRSGKRHWTYDTFAAIWGSPLAADGKVYLGDEEGDVAVLRAGKAKDVLAEINMEGGILSSPVAKNGVLYIMTRERLFALAETAPD